MTREEKGFTLVEVMIAVFIGGILLYVVGNWFLTQTQAYRYLNAQGMFRIAVHLARERAMMERGSIPLASVRQGGAFQVSFAVGVDPDSYTGQVKPAPPVGGYKSGLKTGKPYRVLIQGLMPDNPTSADGKAAMSNSDFWSLNDRVCEVTSVTSTGTGGSDEVVCRCTSAVKSSGFVDLSTLSLTSWPLTLAQSAKARTAVVVNLIPRASGGVIDTDTGETMSSNDFAVLKDRGSVIEYFFNTDRLRRAVHSPLVMWPADVATEYSIVFDQMGGTVDGALYSLTLSWWEAGASAPLGSARYRILPSGELR